MAPSLITPELLRRLEQFQLLAARRAKSSAKGERRSRARGQSVEFADYRNYVAGDDFRYLDWNLFGRLDKLFLKLYEEERELPVTIFLDASESMTFGTPRKFDFARQAILYLPPRMPDPRSPEFAMAAGRQVIEILKRTEGRAFVLFTSYAALRTIQAMAEMALDYPLLVQGTAPRTELLRRFRQTAHAVLFATASFWQGVDVVGEALSCVIVDRLPFASPSDPVTSARLDAIKAERDRYVTTGALPESDEMLPHLWQYQSDLHRARAGLSKAYQAAMDALVRAGDDERLKALAAQKAEFDAKAPGRQGFDADTTWKGSHHAGAAQNSQVLRDEWLRRAEFLHQIVDAPLALAEFHHDGDADRGGEGAQQRAG